MKNISALGCQNYLLQTPCESCFPSFSWIFSFNLQSVDHVVVAYLYPVRSAMDQSWICSVVVGSAYWSWGACPAGASSCWLFVERQAVKGGSDSALPCAAILSSVPTRRLEKSKEDWSHWTTFERRPDRDWLSSRVKTSQESLARSLARSLSLDRNLGRISLVEGLVFVFTGGRLEFTVTTQVFPSLYLISFLPKFPFFYYHLCIVNCYY